MLLIASASNAGSVSEIAGVIEAIVAVINLALVLGFFFAERKEYYRREAIRVREENYATWYRFLVIEKLVPELDEYYKQVSKIISNAEKDAKKYPADFGTLGKNMELIKDIFYPKKRILLTTLQIFDDGLKKEAVKKLQDKHETLLSGIEGLFTGNVKAEQILEELNASEQEVYQLLYNFDMQTLDSIIKERNKRKTIFTKDKMCKK